MTKEAVGAALLVLGVVVGRLTFTGEYLAFVKESLAIPLWLSVAVLVGLGLATLLDDLRKPVTDGPDDHGALGADAIDHTHGDHGHDHGDGGGPRMGALLLAPVAVLMLVPAAPLGSFAAGNGSANRVAESTVFGELPEAAEDGAVDLLLTEVIGRAVLEPDTIDDASLRTIGFVAPMPDGDPDRYLLSRFTVGCCAVDAAPFQLVVEADGDVPAPEEWVEATLRFTGESIEDGEEQLPIFELVTQELIPQPDVPYIY